MEEGETPPWEALTGDEVFQDAVESQEDLEELFLINGTLLHLLSP